MSVEIERRLRKSPVINGIVRLLKSVRFSALEGLSLYDIMEMYIIGIIQGTLSARASSIAFSLFLALFPLLIFLITLVPFIIPYLSIGNENFDTQFLLFLESRGRNGEDCYRLLLFCPFFLWPMGSTPSLAVLRPLTILSSPEISSNHMPTHSWLD